jgi:hypothetical protein
MPPWPTWFRGADDVRTFLETPRFQGVWARGLRATLTRANGLPALVFYAGGAAADGEWRLHSIQVVRWEGGAVAEVTTFVGPGYARGFGVVEAAERSV